MISDSKASVTLTTDNSNQIITFKYTRVYGSITIQYLADGVVLLSDETLISDSKASVTLTTDNSNQIITFKYTRVYGSITIQYLADGVVLLSDETYTQLDLGTYSYQAKSITGYSLTSEETISVTLTDATPNQTVNFNYEKIYGSVTVHYLADGFGLLPSETQSQLELNTYTYDAPSIDGYELITTTTITVTITVQQPIHTITFEYKKEEEIEFLPLNESLQNEVRYISTYYIKPIVAPSEEVVIDYYITDYYHKEYTDDDYSDTFTVTVHIEDHPDIILRNLKAGDHSVSLGSFTIEHEQKFSILCTDQYGRNSHELFNFFLIRSEPEVKEYMMTKDDLVTYNIKNLISDSKASVTLTTDNSNQIITFKYTRVYGSITIQYLADGVVLLSDETQSQLELNTYTYDAPFIDGYELITTTPITVTITVQQSIHTITFDYKKEEETEFLPLDESLQNEVPYISTYYIKPIVVPGEEVVIDYYITDYYHKEYTDDDYSGTFVVTVHIEDHPDIILRTLKADDHSVSLGSFTFEREQKLSILCTDQYGRNSHELFNFFLVRTEPEVK